MKKPATVYIACLNDSTADVSLLRLDERFPQPIQKIEPLRVDLLSNGKYSKLHIILYKTNILYLTKLF
jgi:hypothetical protein